MRPKLQHETRFDLPNLPIPYLVALVFGGVAQLGCGSDDSRPPETGPDATGGRPSSGSDAGVPSRTCATPRVPDGELQNRASGPSVFGIAVGAELGLYDALGNTECGIAGMRVCRRGWETCTETDAAGQFVLSGLPSDQDVDISFEMPGHVPVLRPVHTGSAPINLGQTRVLAIAAGAEVYSKLGVELDPQKGSLVVAPVAASDGIGALLLPEDVVVTLEPSGPDPIYSVGAEKPGALSSDDMDPALRSTRAGGWALFLNVEPGEYSVRFERGGRPCDQAIPGFGYGADADGNIRFSVAAGCSTAGVSAFCP